MLTHAENATRRIREMILQGRFEPGAHLQEIPLAELLGISRTPVRTALHSLALEGLLDYQAKRGYVVRRFSVDELVEAYEVRATLEGMACRLAAERGVAPRVVETLRGCLATGERLFAPGVDDANFDRAAWQAMNHCFHNAILDAAGNRTLAELVAQAQRAPMANFRVIATLNEAKSIALIRQAHLDHCALVDALARGQSARAEARMREHLHIAGELLRRDYEAALARSALDATGPATTTA